MGDFITAVSNHVSRLQAFLRAIRKQGGHHPDLPIYPSQMETLITRRALAASPFMMGGERPARPKRAGPESLAIDPSEPVSREVDYHSRELGACDRQGLFDKLKEP